jgi:hypothetical protein
LEAFLRLEFRIDALNGMSWCIDGISLLENTMNFIIHRTADYLNLTRILPDVGLADVVLIKTAANKKEWPHEKRANEVRQWFAVIINQNQHKEKTQ